MPKTQQMIPAVHLGVESVDMRDRCLCGGKGTCAQMDRLIDDRGAPEVGEGSGVGQGAGAGNDAHQMVPGGRGGQ